MFLSSGNGVITLCGVLAWLVVDHKQEMFLCFVVLKVLYVICVCQCVFHSLSCSHECLVASHLTLKALALNLLEAISRIRLDFFCMVLVLGVLFPALRNVNI